MKKRYTFAAAALTALMLTSCGSNSYFVSLGESDIYSADEIQHAVNIVDNYIQNNKTFKRFDIHCIEFAGDDVCREESREGLNRNGVEYSQIMVLTSDFKTPKFDLFGDMDGFNSDQEYEGWGWILGRKSGEDWTIVGKGVL